MKRSKIKALAAIIISIAITVAGAVMTVNAEVDEAVIATASDNTNTEADSNDTATPNAGTEADERNNVNEESNPFSELYSLICAHADDIFSSLAFVGTLIIAVIYKRVLLPAVTGSIGSIGTALGKLREENEKNNAGTDSRLVSAENKLVSVEETLEKLNSSLEAMRASVGNTDEVKRECNLMHLVMEAQVEMLENIFMCSALPQYQKDAVSERIKSMKEKLTDYEYTE